MRIATLLALGATIAVSALGCTITGTVVASRIVQEQRTVERGPRVVVETFNGRIGVVTGGDTQIDVRAVLRGSGTNQADAERDLRQVQLDISQEPGRVIIAVRRLDQPTSVGNSGADLELAVPIDSSLELRTSNDRIESANVTGAIIARTSNGGVMIRGGRGVDAETSNGPLTVNGASGRLQLRTSNGALDIIDAQEALVTAETSNGAITFSGTPAEGSHTFRTSNASIKLALPGDAEFTVEGRTSNGSVSTVFPDLTVGDDSLIGSVGDDPPVRIRADTSNGDLAVTSQP